MIVQKRKWRKGTESLFHGADANKCADEIERIGESPTPQQIVDFARSEETELHKCFEWDDTKAAELWRKRTARTIVQCIVFVEEKIPDDRPEIRVRFYEKDKHGYSETKKIVIVEDRYKALLAQAYAELRAFKAKYSMLEELREILDLIQ